MAELLIQANSHVNAVDKWMFTPLHEAAQKGRTQVCCLLLAFGADPFAKTQDGLKPIDLVEQDDLKILLRDAMGYNVHTSLGSTAETQDFEFANSFQTTTGTVRPDHPRPLTQYELENLNNPFEIVRDFLRSVKLEEYYEALVKERVTMDVLKDMDHEALMKVGGDTYKKVKKIKKMKNLDL